MDIDPLIGVIVPVYNVENYIERCIKSIISQTYYNLEIILVDDGSTDTSGEICEQYAKKDRRIRVVHKGNGGLSEARNLGIQTTSAEYITFIDADDYVCSVFIQRLVEIFFSNNADIAICGYKHGMKEKFPGEKINYVIIQTCTSREMLENWHGKYKHIETIACNKIYKKSLFVDNNIYYPVGYSNFEDVQTTHLLFERARKIVITNERLYYYYKRRGSIMNTVSEKSIRNCISAQNIRINFFQNNGYKEAYERLAIKRQKQYILDFFRTMRNSKLRNINKEIMNLYLKDYNIVCHFLEVKMWERLLFSVCQYLYRAIRVYW